MLSHRYEELWPDAAANSLITIDSVNERVTDGTDLSRSPYVQGSLFSVALARAYGQVTGRRYLREEPAACLLESLERRYLQLRAGQVGHLRVLYRYQEENLF